MSAPHDNHGQTPAAWTAVTIMIIGFLVGAVGIVIATPWVTVAGGGLVVLGAIVGKVMAMLGYGQPPGYHDRGESTTAASFHELHPETPADSRQTGRHAPGTAGEHVED